MISERASALVIDKMGRWKNAYGFGASKYIEWAGCVGAIILLFTVSRSGKLAISGLVGSYVVLDQYATYKALFGEDE